MRIREVLLFGLISMAAVLAQLPPEVLEDHGINRNYLLGVLGCGIVLGLFFYLRFFFFLAVVLLILAANLDQQISEYIQISKIPVILALVAMVGISLINYFVKLMPTGLEPKPKEKSPEGVRGAVLRDRKEQPGLRPKSARDEFRSERAARKRLHGAGLCRDERQRPDGRTAAA